MKSIYTKTHRRHAPPYEFIRNHIKPHSETPTRADKIHQALQEEGFTDIIMPRKYSLDPIRSVHDSYYLRYLENVYAAWFTGRDNANSEIGVIPDTFALRTMGKRPKEWVKQAGYYCFDTQTPVLEATYEAALSSAFCALTGADLLLLGESPVYALCRPPGHHASRDVYGGYCYLNNAAIAATHLSRQEAKVALLDIDYHHGNGTQDLFYQLDQIQVVSIHAHPNRAYPFYCGFEDERGEGPGRGFNHNFPLTAHVNMEQYLTSLDDALKMIQDFAPGFLVVSLGVDTFSDDPLGDFDLPLDAFIQIGKQIAQAQLPTLLIQEGGYNIQKVGDCVVNVLRGFNTVSTNR